MCTKSVAAGLLVCCYLSACAWHTQTPDESRVILMERTRLMKEGLRNPDSFARSADGVILVLSKEEWYVSALYVESSGVWKWHADKGGAPEACLYRGTMVPKAVQKRLHDEALSAAAENNLGDDIESSPCRYTP